MYNELYRIDREKQFVSVKLKKLEELKKFFHEFLNDNNQNEFKILFTWDDATDNTKYCCKKYFGSEIFSHQNTETIK